ncbi:MAG: LLM class F420-dependent oxidoreductase [Actinomycetota bacterium]
MQFSIKTSPQYTTWEDMLAVWTAADDIDVFVGAWNFDHFYPINVPDTTGPCMEAWVTLTALAQATSRLRIGTMVNGIVYRHPAVLAKMATTLDIVSGGRLDLGIGAGWNEEECDAYGIELGTLTERFDRFEEACAVLHGLLTQETTDFDGTYFQLRQARNNPKPIQAPHPPICIGGQGPKRTLPLVARYAQHWNYPGRSGRHLAETLERLLGECEEIGRDPSEIHVSATVWMDAEMGPSAAADLAAQRIDQGADEVLLYLAPPHTPTILEPLADALVAINQR